MKRKKYFMTAVATGLLLCSMTVSAAPDAQYKPVHGSIDGDPDFGIDLDDDGEFEWYHIYYDGTDPTGSDNHGFSAGEAWTPDWNGVYGEYSVLYLYDGTDWHQVTFISDGSDTGSCGSSSETSKASKSVPKDSQAEARAIIQRAQAEALQAEAEAEGFTDGATMQIAQAANKSAGEYYNNAVLTTQGIEEATPVAQGGNLIVDGVETNMTASVSKVAVAFVDSVRAVQDGKVLNVVDVRFPAKAATINFYMPGVAGDANIAAMQYVDGAWVDVEIVEVRADHIVLNLESNGIVAFLAK